MERREIAIVILLVSLASFCGCTGNTKTEAATPTIQQTTTTAASSSTTTSSTTSTTASTSTTTTSPPFRIMCRVNGDCGEMRQERICYEGSVYINRITPMCGSPDTPYAKCMTQNRLSQSPVELCPNSRCAGGRCVS